MLMVFKYIITKSFEMFAVEQVKLTKKALHQLWAVQVQLVAASQHDFPKSG